MNHDDAATLLTIRSEAHGSYSSYILGFVLSLILTLGSYFSVVENIVSGWTIIAIIVSLAILQLFVQLIFFLHLASESKPRWNLMVALFALLVLIVIVVGTLWIMFSLNQRTMPPMNMNKDLIQNQHQPQR